MSASPTSWCNSLAYTLPLFPAPDKPPAIIYPPGFAGVDAGAGFDFAGSLAGFASALSTPPKIPHRRRKKPFCSCLAGSAGDELSAVLAGAFTAPRGLTFAAELGEVFAAD